MRTPVRDRLITAGFASAALLLLICSIGWAHETVEDALNMRPWAHMRVEASLNLLWLMLAAAALAHWATPDGNRRCSRLCGLVTLVFLLSLLFPVISANDDLAQMVLINDANTSQSMIPSIQCHKKLISSANLVGWPAVLPAQLASLVSVALQFVSDSAPALSVATPGAATGNHSPPLR